MKVKIIGAGSIGNHLAQASRRMGWEVVVVDIDSKALLRMKNDIYPKRYGAWDEEIKLVEFEKAPRGGFDVIMIGTPPDVRMGLAMEALSEKPRAVHLEKPLCAPDLKGLNGFLKAYKSQKNTFAVLGYEHAVADSMNFVINLLANGAIGQVLTIDVETREHWRGIFSAHPWLSGPQDTYLGYWRRGGGAGGEHSHALHLWLYLAKVLGWGLVSAKSMMDVVIDGGAEYDRLAMFLLETSIGRTGRVVQDVFTLPTRKAARLQGDNGFIEWHCAGVSDGDLVRWQIYGRDVKEKVFPKKRLDDFYMEMEHLSMLLDGYVNPSDSPISLESGVEVMKILAKAYKENV